MGAGAVGAPARETLKVFVSYRRHDVAGDVHRLVADLERAFGAGSVFMDVDRIPAGRPFAEVISKWVADSDVFVVVIGERWLGREEAGGGARIKRRDDFVRIEVETALESSVAVVPVLIEDAPMPQDADLPKELARLPRLQALTLLRDYWEPGVQRLVHAIRDLVEGEPAGGAADAAETRPQRRRPPLAAMLGIGGLAVVAAAAIALSSGGSGGHHVATSTRAASTVARTTAATATTTSTAATGSTATTTAAPPAQTTPGAGAPVATAATASLSPEQVVALQWREIKNGDYPAAYAYFDSSYQRENSRSRWLTEHAEEGIRRVNFEPRPLAYEGSTPYVEVKRLRTVDKEYGCREWHGRYVMSDNGRWLIDKAKIHAESCHG